MVYLERGINISIPKFSELEPNSNDETIELLLSSLMNFNNNKTKLNINSSKDDYKVSFKHTKYYLFQPHNLVANPESIFYRQSESSYIFNTIKETLPTILEADNSGKTKLLNQLREIKREISILEKNISNLESENFNNDKLVASFIEEAKILGFHFDKKLELYKIIDILESIDENNINPINPALSKISDIKRNILMLRKKRNSYIDQLDVYKNFITEKNSFIKNKNIELQRLSAINYFKETEVTSDNNFKELNDLIDTEFKKLSNNISKISIDSSNKKISIAEVNIRKNLDSIDIELNDLNNKLSSLNALNNNYLNESNRLKSTFILIGKIKLFLSNYKENNDLEYLKNKLTSAKAKQDTFINLLDGMESREELLDDIIFKISMIISDYLKLLGYEHSHGSTRFDLKKLTLFSSTPDGITRSMDRVGSSTNHLFLHLSCLLAFHLYFHQNLCPVPSFLVLDQPSQVCFPEIYPYETLKDNYELYIKSLDIIEVKAIFKFLLKYTKEYYKDFQIILLEHAFIDEPWFTELLVEEQWIDDKALIPSSWIN